MDELGQQGPPAGPPEHGESAWASPTVDVLVGGPGQPGDTIVRPSARRSRRGVVAGLVAVLLVVSAAVELGHFQERAQNGRAGG